MGWWGRAKLARLCICICIIIVWLAIALALRQLMVPLRSVKHFMFIEIKIAER